jgi:hypothetical protein
VFLITFSLLLVLDSATRDDTTKLFVVISPSLFGEHLVLFLLCSSVCIVLVGPLVEIYTWKIYYLFLRPVLR